MGVHDDPSGPMDYLFIFSKDTNDYILINLGIFSTVHSLNNDMSTHGHHDSMNIPKIKEFLAIRRAISLNETFVLFCRNNDWRN